MIKIALISDSGAIRDLINNELRNLNYEVIIIINNRQGIEKLIKEKPDVILIDMNSLLKEGEILVNRLLTIDRIKESVIFVITSEDKLKKHNFLLDIDDFLLAPLSIQELDTRLRRSLHKEKPVTYENVIKVDGLVINPISFEVTIDNTSINLTYKEFELLKLLVSNRGRVYSRDSLLSIVWKYDFYEETRTVDNHIRRIRLKIGEKYGSMIRTVRKVGYKFI